MVAFVIAFAFGIFEAVVLKKTLFSVTSGDYTKAVVFLIIKLLTYSAAVSLLVFVFLPFLIPCVVGFSLGLPFTVIIWFIYKNWRQNIKVGDDENENINIS